MKRFWSDPVLPDWGRPATKFCAKWGWRRMNRIMLVNASGDTRFAAREAGAVADVEQGRVDADRVDQESPLDLDALRPASPAPELPAELLEQHVGVPVLAGIQDRKDPVAERAAVDLRQRRRQLVAVAYRIESVVLRVVPRMLMPASASA